MFNCDEKAAYSATSLAFRDRLILDWNKTQQRQTYLDSKRVYYLSLEFLMGRALDNAMLNVGMKDTAKGASPTLLLFVVFTDANYQLVLLTLASVLRTSLARNTMLLWATVVLVD